MFLSHCHTIDFHPFLVPSSPTKDDSDIQACEVWHNSIQFNSHRWRSLAARTLFDFRSNDFSDAGNYATGGAGAPCGSPIPCSSTGRVHRLVWQSRGEGLWSVPNEFWFLLLAQFMIWSPTMADAVGFCDDFRTSTFPTLCWRMSYKKYSYVTSHKYFVCFWSSLFLKIHSTVMFKLYLKQRDSDIRCCLQLMVLM